jgi:TM2 domain-containing membrane protein YozV
MNISPKSRIAATLFAFFLGMFGAHRFYVGKTGTAIAQVILTCTILLSPISGIWAIVDFIMIVAGSFRDKEGRLIVIWDPAANVVYSASASTPSQNSSQNSEAPRPDTSSPSYTPPVGDTPNQAN